MPDIAVILPTLDERDNLAPMIERLAAALDGLDWEAVIVDDDSRDGTADEARALAQANPRVRAIQRIGRRGLASAVIEGACATAAPVIAVMDADHQHDPALIPPMLEKLRSIDGEGADLVVASRFAEGASADGLSSARRERGSRLANRLARMLTGVDLSDPMSGFFMIETARLRALAPRLSGIGFKILLDILAVSPERLRVAEVPMRFGARRSGESKLDRAVAFEFLVMLYERYLGRIVPTRFALFGTVGGAGVLVHMGVLALFYPGMTATFWKAQALATFAAMTFNFWLNNWLTYRDKRLRTGLAWLRGWAVFCTACAVGALANVALASFLQMRGINWVLAALAGIVVGAVWNYALSNRFVWGRV
ncbi:glycosyltransferase [Alteriqipengyuania lutimaris]|uniref:Glycosyltransferase family 2 protein n=1 Tax=Alteriqipengyuania lutimaris TaxID=1538146 RepID=A0A395LMS8_9SPHN|nr:glycosyltransferase family 2 protein [Alteriqipengyuania lutimaris]MBB3035343.1 dolichol-phosphate mannosyltransferase [Alteriqipengyuania lutimaris]RDS75930.1 glycosyltransferase family 2 protein [Alteriqipengyuania lutimaris]